MIQLLSNSIAKNFKKIVISICIWITGLGLFPSCTPTTVVPKQVEPTIYRSEDYILYQLQDTETPQELAEKFLGTQKTYWRIEEANPGVTFSTGRFIVIPLKEKNKGGLNAEGYQVVPILTYHRFDETCLSQLCTPTHIFEKQMKYIYENGYHVITPEDLLAFLDYRQALPKKSVMITMDDGFRSVYKIAYPILKKYGFTATLFVYTDYVGISDSAVTWEQLRDLKAHGFSIGSHTISHSDLTMKMESETDQNFSARIKKELNGSKEIIDRELGQDTYVLAYPFGNYDQRAIECTRQAGYKLAMSVKRGGNAFFTNPLSLKRDQILTEDMQLFYLTLISLKKLPLE